MDSLKIRNAVAIILYTPEQKILLQHRTPDAPRNPNKWGCFGGGIEPGESTRDAIIRECEEELGYTLKNPCEFMRAEFVSDELCMRITYFSELYDTTQVLDLREGQALGWYTLSEARALEITKTTLHLIDALEAGTAKLRTQSTRNAL